MDQNSVDQAALTTPSDDDIDRGLVARFLAGNESAFDEIVAAHTRRLAHLAYRLLGSCADVEDVVQEVFVAVLSNLHRFRGDSQFSTWLTRIAVNKCRSHQRRHLLWRRSRVRLIKRQQEASSNHQEDDSPESHDAVREAVQALPGKFREPIVLRYFQQMSVSEIADVLGLSTGAVEVRLSRARQRLKDELGHQYNKRIRHER